VVEVKARSNRDAPGLRLSTLPYADPSGPTITTSWRTLPSPPELLINQPSEIEPCQNLDLVTWHPVRLVDARSARSRPME
jgi:hypothetical protein